MTNTTKVSFGETWTTITTTWSSEIRTWLATGSLFTNINRIEGSEVLWSYFTTPWTLTAPWAYTPGMTNISKPT